MHIKHNPITKIVFYPIILLVEKIGKYFPKLWMKTRYFIRFHKKVNLESPQDLNEKILWLAFNTDTSAWSRLSDKYAVKEFVKERGLAQILIPNIIDKNYYNVDDIDLDTLPNSFVIKCNNGCGLLKIVRDKSQLDKAKLKDEMKSWLSYDMFGCEKHYRNIKNSLFIEQLLPIDSSIIDYKVWCFNGKPYTILTCSNRTKDNVNLGCYDLDWNYHPENLIASKNYPLEPQALPRPENLEEMLAVAERLSQGFQEVRVDLYNIKGRIYFGEMTFTSLGGMMDYYTPDFLLEMGSLIDLNYKG